MGLVEEIEKVASLQYNFVRVISHLDADGLSSAGIVATALKRKGIGFHLSIIKQLDAEEMERISNEQYDQYILLDFGSAKVEEIEATGKRFVVLDHHQPIRESENQVNPHFFGVDGSTQVSASGLAYLFAKAMDPANSDLSHLAIVGATGDQQEKGEFTGLNADLLKEAISAGTIKVKKGLRVFGRVSRPVHRALHYSTDPFIPGVSGSESGAIEFLSEIGISPQENGKWRTISDLSEEELKKLISAIIIRRSDLPKPGDVIGNVYEIQGEVGLLSDVQEFSTVLNALGRSNKQSVAIGLFIGDKSKALAQIEEILSEYKKAVVQAINTIKAENLRNEEEDILYIMGGEHINDAIIGTVTSIFAMSSDLSQKEVVVGFAKRKDGFKVSCRSKSLEIGELISNVAERVGGEGGRHDLAAGAQIPNDSLEQFMELFTAGVKRLKNTRLTENRDGKTKNEEMD